MPATATLSPPVPAGTMDEALASYQAYVGAKLADLGTQILTLKASVGNNDLEAAREQWLAAQLTWQEVGAAYGSFGDLGAAINALPSGFAAGPSDPGFTGLHRVEYGLYHGQGPAELMPVLGELGTNVGKLVAKLPELTVAPSDMPLRCHEILEDSLRDNLSGNNDQGSGMSLALTSADVSGTRVVLTLLSTLIDGQKRGYTATIAAELDSLDAALNATRTNGRWPDYRTVPLSLRQPVNGAIGRALETLAYVPAMFATED
ncbi:EfeM/EfeO family lipoprotein (plasmid) [Arthrobacter sp. YA7-1]|uniref:EfeM/EfeO family lipoprotein n=1 Tax=Arthrobacter sp. YA7-1 TaxID=2987701 RepID=UPI002227A8B5|nr:EfeM/EfeO family lipoprotein [Arthrobacter sp. YA7-1]UYY83635.1 EfeM/EfeO family lipoprotein [Arthrobacter sp. YA7-1]